jgi:signal transduction histidine kinase
MNRARKWPDRVQSHGQWNAPKGWQAGRYGPYRQIDWQPGKRLFRFFVFVTIGFFVIPLLAGVALTATFTGWTSIAVAAIFLAAFLIVGVLLARFLFRNLRIVRDLISFTGRLADGDYSARVSTPTSPAVKPVTDSFNQMADRLEVADELRRRLLADVGHELRTPLTVVRGELEAMADGVRDLDPEQIRLLLDDIDVMERLLDDLRTLSMTEAGMVNLEKETTDLGVLVGDLVDRFLPQAKAEEVHISCLAPEAVQMEIDPYRFGQVINNLLANALRAASPGDRITVTVGAGSNSTGIVTVQDTGRGIPEDQIDAVFDRFHKGTDSNGSGLGLTISRDLVTAHGGTISIASQTGVGTTATITVPLAAGKPN